jgi:hypothetical protein
MEGVGDHKLNPAIVGKDGLNRMTRPGQRIVDN